MKTEVILSNGVVNLCMFSESKNTQTEAHWSPFFYCFAWTCHFPKFVTVPWDLWKSVNFEFNYEQTCFPPPAQHVWFWKTNEDLLILIYVDTQNTEDVSARTCQPLQLVSCPLKKVFQIIFFRASFFKTITCVKQKGQWVTNLSFITKYLGLISRLI